jgi:hypothetical protein
VRGVFVQSLDVAGVGGPLGDRQPVGPQVSSLT